MSVNIFELEYEVRASSKMVFPYLSTASGLASWFADDVIIKPKGEFDFLWDGEHHIGHVTIKKQNKEVLIDLEGEGNYVSIELETNEFTQSLFLKIVDASDMADSDEECAEIWDGLVDELKDQFGG